MQNFKDGFKLFSTALVGAFDGGVARFFGFVFALWLFYSISNIVSLVFK